MKRMTKTWMMKTKRRTKNGEKDGDKDGEKEHEKDNKKTNGDNTDKMEGIKKHNAELNNTDENKLDAEVLILRSDDSDGKEGGESSKSNTTNHGKGETEGSVDKVDATTDSGAVSAILVGEQSKIAEDTKTGVLTVEKAKHMCEKLEGLLTLLKESLGTGEDISGNTRKEISTRAKSVVDSLSQIFNE